MYWIAFGDVHENTSTLGSIEGLTDAAGVIVCGDLTNHGTRPAAMQVLDACRAANPVVYAQIGNMDTAEVDALLNEQEANMHRRVLPLGPQGSGVGLAGVGWSTPTPFHTPSEVDEQTLASWLEELEPHCAGYQKLIFAVHTPPAETATDRLSSGAHVGSQAVRQFIERVQPQVCITGHIHESRGVDRIGRCTVINPGMLAHGGYARITLGPDGRLDATLEKS